MGDIGGGPNVKAANTVQSRITRGGCLHLLNCGALNLVADLNGDASRFSWPFIFKQKCARFYYVHLSFPCLFPCHLKSQGFPCIEFFLAAARTNLCPAKAVFDRFM